MGEERGLDQMPDRKCIKFVRAGPIDERKDGDYGTPGGGKEGIGIERMGGAADKDTM